MRVVMEIKIRWELANNNIPKSYGTAMQVLLYSLADGDFYNNDAAVWRVIIHDDIIPITHLTVLPCQGGYFVQIIVLISLSDDDIRSKNCTRAIFLPHARWLPSL